MAFLILSSGCGGRPHPTSAGNETAGKQQTAVIHVAAATDLQPWLGEALSAWGRKQNPAIEVLTSYDASGKIAAQVRAGAPIDLFLSADIDIVRKLAAEGLIDPDSVKPYAQGRLALIFRKSLGLADWKKIDLADFRHLVIANPATAPYGKAAKAAIEQAGFWPKLESKIVVADSVRQALEQVLTGNAEAGLVALGHAHEAAAKNAMLAVLELPLTDHPPIVQGLGLVKHPDQSEISRNVALKIIDHLTRPETTELFEQHSLQRMTNH